MSKWDKERMRTEVGCARQQHIPVTFIICQRLNVSLCGPAPCPQQYKSTLRNSCQQHLFYSNNLAKIFVLIDSLAVRDLFF